MQVYQLSEIEGHNIEVTSTATTVLTLINAQMSPDQAFPTGLNAIDIYVIDADVRVSWGAEAPTATRGVLLKQNAVYSFRGRSLANMRLIRVGASDVTCDVTIGFTSSDDESESVAYLA